MKEMCGWKERRITEDEVNTDRELSPQDDDGLLPFSVENRQTAEQHDINTWLTTHENQQLYIQYKQPTTHVS